MSSFCVTDFFNKINADSDRFKILALHSLISIRFGNVSSYKHGWQWGS